MKSVQPKVLALVAVAFLSGVLLVLAARSAFAGPITAGVPTKLAIYQGVLSIVPNSTNAMEIGNNGTDIASNTDLYFRPGNLSRSANTNAYFTSLAGKATLRLAGTASIGSTTAPTSKLLVNNNTVGAGSAQDAIAAYANNATGAALYAQQSNAAAWAGYFSGRVNVTSDLIVGGTLTVGANPITQSCFVDTSATPFPGGGSPLYPPNTTYSNTYVYYTSSFTSGTVVCGGVVDSCGPQWRAPGNTACTKNLLGDAGNPCAPGCSTNCRAPGTLQTPSHYYFCRTS